MSHPDKILLRVLSLCYLTGSSSRTPVSTSAPTCVDQLTPNSSKDNDETFQAYSSFTTNHKPADQYEELLVKASKGRSQALKAYQRREELESALVRLWRMFSPKLQSLYYARHNLVFRSKDMHTT